MHVRQKIRVRVAIIAIFACSLVTVALLWESGFQKFPIRALFEVQHLGAKAALDFRADKSRVHLFQLAFGFSNTTERERLRTLVGHNRQRLAIRNGSTPLPIAVHMTLTRLDSSEVSKVYDKSIFNIEGTGFSASEFFMQIDKAVLDPGEYRVNIESLSGLPELSQVPASLLVTIYPIWG